MNSQPKFIPAPLLVAPGTITRTRPSPPRDCVWRHPSDRVVVHPPIVNTRLDVARVHQIETDLKSQAEAEAKIRMQKEKELLAENQRLSKVIENKLREQQEEFKKAALDREERHKLEDKEAKENLKTKRLELESEISSRSDRNPEKPKITYVYQKEAPSLHDKQLPPILIFEKTDQSLFNCPLPVSFSRALKTRISEKDSTISITAKSLSENISRSETFNLGGGFQSIGPTQITTLVRKRVLMNPSKPARISTLGTRQPVPKEKPNQCSIIDGNVNEVLPILAPFPSYRSTNQKGKPQDYNRLKEDFPDQNVVIKTKDSVNQLNLNHNSSTAKVRPTNNLNQSKEGISHNMSVYRDTIDGISGGKPSTSKDKLHQQLAAPYFDIEAPANPFFRPTPQRQENIPRHFSHDQTPGISTSLSYQPASNREFGNKTKNISRDLSPKAFKSGDEKRFEKWLNERNSTCSNQRISHNNHLSSEKWPLYKEYLEYQVARMEEEDKLPEEAYYEGPNYVRIQRKSSKNRVLNQNLSQNSLSNKGYTFSKGKTDRLPSSELNCGLRVQKLPSYETKNLKEPNDKRKLDAWRKGTDRDYDKIGRMIAKTEMHDAKIYSAKLDEGDIIRRATETDEQRLDRIAWECSSHNLFSNLDRKKYLESEAIKRTGGYNQSFDSRRSCHDIRSLNGTVHKSEIDGFEESYGIMQSTKGKVYTFFCEKYGTSK